MSEPLIINQFQNAIGDSAHTGFGLMRCVDIEAFPGAVKVQNIPSTIFHTAFSGTFTAAADDVCTLVGGAPTTTGTAVTVSTTGVLPAGLSAGTNYFIIAVSGTTVKLATTIALAGAGTAVDITDAGSGTHTMTTVDPGTVNHIVRKVSGVRFLQDSNGRVWYLQSGASRCFLLNGNTLTGSAGNGIVVFQNSDASATYLFAFRNGFIDVINVTATANLETPSWTNGWQSLNSGTGTGNRHHAIHGQDNIIYYTDDRYIGSIRELTIFDPSSGATFTFNQDALDTPSGEVLVHLEELGANLLAAGQTYDHIYPWDRVSDSFNLPISVPERQVFRLKNIGGTVFILAGTSGNIYMTQGTYVKHFKKLPDQVINNSGSLQSNVVTWGGIDALNGSLLVGASVLTSGNNGVYRIYPDGRLVIHQIPSTSSTSVTALEVSNTFFYMGYASGADELTTSRYSSFQGVIQSAFYVVGTKTNKTKYSLLEVVIAKPASSGNVRVSYRTDTSSSFTTLDTFAADSTNTTFKNDAIGLIDIENIQIQAEVDGTVELVEIRLLP